ncbi:hypothetical protein BD779DRAFT_465716 [Infundibulicybe gibba]|nr:hypothetical protein BD779DRAFT_465716 [Infundibulicybe gibba]
MLGWYLVGASFGDVSSECRYYECRRTSEVVPGKAVGVPDGHENRAALQHRGPRQPILGFAYSPSCEALRTTRVRSSSFLWCLGRECPGHQQGSLGSSTFIASPTPRTIMIALSFASASRCDIFPWFQKYNVVGLVSTTPRRHLSSAWLTACSLGLPLMLTLVEARSFPKYSGPTAAGR